MISKKSLILNLCSMLFTTIVLFIVLFVDDLSNTIKYFLIGTVFIISAFSFMFNKRKF